MTTTKKTFSDTVTVTYALTDIPPEAIIRWVLAKKEAVIAEMQDTHSRISLGYALRREAERHLEKVRQHVRDLEWGLKGLYPEVYADVLRANLDAQIDDLRGRIRVLESVGMIHSVSVSRRALQRDLDAVQAARDALDKPDASGSPAAAPQGAVAE